MALNLGTVPGLERIAIRLPNSRFPNADGMQEAHIYGKQFIARALKHLLDLIDPNRTQSDPDASAMGVRKYSASTFGHFISFGALLRLKHICLGGVD